MRLGFSLVASRGALACLVQENAQMLTEEGKLLSSVQGETVVDYDIDEYASKLEDVRATGRELRDTRAPRKYARPFAHQPLWCWFDF